MVDNGLRHLASESDDRLIGDPLIMESYGYPSPKPVGPHTWAVETIKVSCVDDGPSILHEKQSGCDHQQIGRAYLAVPKASGHSAACSDAVSAVSEDGWTCRSHGETSDDFCSFADAETVADGVDSCVTLDIENQGGETPYTTLDLSESPTQAYAYPHFHGGHEDQKITKPVSQSVDCAPSCHAVSAHVNEPRDCEDAQGCVEPAMSAMQETIHPVSDDKSERGLQAKHVVPPEAPLEQLEKDREALLQAEQICDGTAICVEHEDVESIPEISPEEPSKKRTTALLEASKNSQASERVYEIEENAMEMHKESKTTSTIEHEKTCAGNDIYESTCLLRDIAPPEQAIEQCVQFAHENVQSESLTKAESDPDEVTDHPHGDVAKQAGEATMFTDEARHGSVNIDNPPEESEEDAHQLKDRTNPCVELHVQDPTSTSPSACLAPIAHASEHAQEEHVHATIVQSPVLHMAQEIGEFPSACVGDSTESIDDNLKAVGLSQSEHAPTCQVTGSEEETHRSVEDVDETEPLREESPRSSQCRDEEIEDVHVDQHQQCEQNKRHPLPEIEKVSDSEQEFVTTLNDTAIGSFYSIEVQAGTSLESHQPPLERSVTAPEPRQRAATVGQTYMASDLADSPIAEHDINISDELLLNARLRNIAERGEKTEAVVQTVSMPADLGKAYMATPPTHATFATVVRETSFASVVRENSFAATVHHRVVNVLNSFYTPAESVQCCICLENVQVDNIKTYAACNHEERGTCSDCLTGHLTSLITDGRVKDLFCPLVTEDCKALPTQAELVLLLDEATLAKYHRFLEQTSDPNLRECPKCHKTISPQVDKDGVVTVAEMICTCGQKFCFYHSNAHAPGRSACKEYTRMLHRQEQQNKATIDTKGCPKCGVDTQKAGGCNHMTCRCGAQWCWICGKALGSGAEVGWHYNPVNPKGCMQFQDPVEQGDHRRLVCFHTISRFLAFPGALVTVLILIASLLFGLIGGIVFALLVGLPCELYFRIRKSTAHSKGQVLAHVFLTMFCVLLTSLALPLVIIWGICWAIIAAFLFSCILTCGASIHHYGMIATAPLTTIVSCFEMLPIHHDGAAAAQNPSLDADPEDGGVSLIRA